jgi:CRP-like cAMP-binding protein
MDPATLQQVRAIPLFAELDNTQLGFIEPGEIITVPGGTVLVSEGERCPFFFVVLEGEIRVVRTYDRQTVLMGVIKPGHFTG